MAHTTTRNRRTRRLLRQSNHPRDFLSDGVDYNILVIGQHKGAASITAHTPNPEP
jgi:hypothetical protein